MKRIVSRGAWKVDRAVILGPLVLLLLVIGGWSPALRAEVSSQGEPNAAAIVGLQESLVVKGRGFTLTAAVSAGVNITRFDVLLDDDVWQAFLMLDPGPKAEVESTILLPVAKEYGVTIKVYGEGDRLLGSKTIRVTRETGPPRTFGVFVGLNKTVDKPKEIGSWVRRTFGVFVGLNKAVDEPKEIGSRPRLTYAEDDAERLARTLNQQGTMSADSTITLVGLYATRKKLEEKLAGLSLEMADNDSVVFYYSGPAVTRREGEGFTKVSGLLLYGDPDAGGATLPLGDLGRMIRALQPAKAYIILDTCVAGDVRELVQGLRDRDAIVVYGCGRESEAYKGGVFTYHLNQQLEKGEKLAEIDSWFDRGDWGQSVSGVQERPVILMTPPEQISNTRVSK